MIPGRRNSADFGALFFPRPANYDEQKVSRGVVPFSARYVKIIMWSAGLRKRVAATRNMPVFEKGSLLSWKAVKLQIIIFKPFIVIITID